MKKHRRRRRKGASKARRIHRRIHRRSKRCAAYRKGRKCVGAYARFAKAMWKKHRGHYKSIGFRRAGKAIGAAWKSHCGKGKRRR